MKLTLKLEIEVSEDLISPELDTAEVVWVNNHLLNVEDIYLHSYLTGESIGKITKISEVEISQ